MSALAHVRIMSALPPKADMVERVVMSALCHKRTYAVQQRTSLFDHLVGGGEQSWWHSETERSRCLEINDQLELARLLDRKVGGLLVLEDAIDIGCGAAEQVCALNTVSDQASAPGELRNRIDCGQVLLRRRGDDHLTMGTSETVRQSDQASGLLTTCHGDGTAEFDLVANGRNDQLEFRGRTDGFHCGQKHSRKWRRIRVEYGRNRFEARRDFAQQLHP